MNKNRYTRVNHSVIIICMLLSPCISFHLLWIWYTILGKIYSQRKKKKEAIHTYSSKMHSQIVKVTRIITTRRLLWLFPGRRKYTVRTDKLEKMGERMAREDGNKYVHGKSRRTYECSVEDRISRWWRMWKRIVIN